MGSKREKMVAAMFISGASFMLVAMSVNPTYWWIGVLIGFCVGWIFYDPRGLLVSLRQEWHEASLFIEELRTKQAENLEWKRRHLSVICRQRRRYLLWKLGSALAVASYTLFGLTLNLMSNDIKSLDSLKELSFLESLLIFFPIVLSGLKLTRTPHQLEGFCGDPKEWPHETRVEYGRKLQHEANAQREFSIWWNLPVAIGYQLPRMIIVYVIGAAPKWVPITLKALARATVAAIRKVHCEERLLCGTWGVAGGTLTYFLAGDSGLTKAGLVLAGGLVSVLFGMLDYHLVRRIKPDWFPANGTA
jgi:hypothetical protein